MRLVKAIKLDKDGKSVLSMKMAQEQRLNMDENGADFVKV